MPTATAIKVRAKVQCTNITEAIYDEWLEGKPTRRTSWSYNFKFAGGHETEENKKFWDYSPDGQLSIRAIKDNLYEVGQWYYLDWILTTAEGTE